MENDVKNAKLTDKPNDFREVFSALRGLASELWDAAERLEAAYGVVVDALNDTCPCDEGMLVLVTKPGYYTKVGGNNVA